MLLQCARCDITFERKDVDRRLKQVFCSRKCCGLFRTESRTITKACKVCGTEFRVKRGQQGAFSTCPSKECRRAYRKQINAAMHAANVKDRRADCHPELAHFALGLCKQCYDTDYAKRNRTKTNATKTRWRKANKKRVSEVRRKYLYGVEAPLVEERLSRQGGLCAICCVRPATDLDHDHTSGKPRGMLCGDCNRGIGLMRENEDTLLRAAEYVREWRDVDAAA